MNGISEPKSSKPRAKRRRGAFIAAVCILVVSTVFIMAMFAIIHMNQRLSHSFDDDVEMHEQAIVDAGQPLTLEALDAYYPTIPEEENAAPIYDRAFSLYGGIDPDGKSLEELYSRLTMVNRGDASLQILRDEIGSYLAECGEVLQLLEQAAMRPKGRYAVEPSSYYTVGEFAHWGSLLRCAKLEALRAIHLALDGRQTESIECHRIIAHMANSLWMEPLTMSQYYRVNVIMVNIKAFEAELNVANLHSETLANLESLFAEPDSETPLIRGLAGDRCLLMNFMQNSGADKRLTPKDRAAQILDSVSHSNIHHMLDQSEKLGIYRWYEALVEQAGEPWDIRLKYVASISTNGKPWKRAEVKGHPMFNTLASTEYMAMDTTISRIGRVVIAIEKFHDANGVIPPDLGILVPDYIPAIPLDPYDGLPIRYAVSNQDYMVYTVFLDRVDDGGGSSQVIDEVRTVGDWGIVVARSPRWAPFFPN